MINYDDDDREYTGRGGGSLQDRLKRTILGGLDAAGLNEETLLKNIKSMKITREAAEYLEDQTKKTRQDAIDHTFQEVKELILSEEVRESVLESLTSLKMNIQISFDPKDKSKVEVKRKKKTKNSKDD